MKSALLVVAALIALPLPVHAADIDPAAIQLWDVIYTTEGTVLKGVIVEEIPGTSVRILLLGGSSIVVPVATVERFAKELNPGFTRAPAGSAAKSADGSGSPGLAATSGFRFGAMPGLAFHTESGTSLLLSTHLGWEIALGRWGLTPNVAIDYVLDAGPYEEDGVALIPGLRAAYRGSTVSPFFGFSFGVDTLDGDLAPAITLGGGIDLILHRRFAISAEARFHRGFGDQYTDLMSYVAIGVGVEVRL
jgi:hypothetical protein